MITLKRLDAGIDVSDPEQPDLFGVLEQHDTLEMTRIASAVLSKTPDDLAAMAACNGLLRARWLEAFARRKAAAETDAKFWAAAMAHLSTATTAAHNDATS
jgi:hypothetical protein